jgi:hypothetical protein
MAHQKPLPECNFLHEKIHNSLIRIEKKLDRLSWKVYGIGACVAFFFAILGQYVAGKL